MTVKEPQDGNMTDFDNGFVEGCGFFELVFTGCCGNADKE